MKETIRNFFTGIVGLVALVGFAALLMLFGELDFLRRDRWIVNVTLNDAGGLRAGSTVTLNGVPIGIIERVEAQRNIEKPVLIVASIDHHHDIPQPVTPVIQASLIGGGAVLRLQTDPATSSFADPYPRDGTVTIPGVFVALPDQIAQTLSTQLRPLLESLQGFSALAATYETLGRDLDDLVRPLTDEELAAGGVANLRVTIAHLNGALAEAEETLADMRGWVGDWLGDPAFRAQMKDDLGHTMREANILLTNANSAVEEYQRLAITLARDADEVTAKITPVAEEMTRTLVEVRTLVQNATSGEGTIGRLISRPDLYLSLLDASKRLDRALAETELLLAKVRQEGLKLNMK